MESIIIIILITAFLALSSIITTSNVFKSEEKGFKKFTKTGYFIIVVNICIIILTVFQYSINKKELIKSEKNAVKKQNYKDSILRLRYDSALFVMKKKYDTTNIKTISVVTELLAIYGFKLDSSNQKLQKIIKGSSKTLVVLPNDPVLQICGKDGIVLNRYKNNKYYFDVNLCSKDASCTNFGLFCPVVLEDSTNKLLLFTELKIPSDYKIASDDHVKLYLTIPNNYKFNFIYILISGNYKNTDYSKSYSVNDLYYYNSKGHTYGLMGGDTKKRIISFIKKEINKQ